MIDYVLDVDFANDFISWLKLKDSYSNTEELQEKIIQDNEPGLACFFAAEYTYKSYKMQKIVLDSKLSKYAYLFAKSVNGCDIQALQKIVVESNKNKYICKFACYVNGADFTGLQNIILKTNNPKYAHMLLKHGQTPDIEKIKKIILKCDKPRYLFELAKHTIDKLEISKIEDAIIKLQSYNYIRLMAENIKMCDVEKLEEAILQSNDVRQIKKFAKNVKKSKMRQFLTIL